jgi:hypothetical protein
MLGLLLCNSLEESFMPVMTLIEFSLIYESWRLSL